jgi:hypothetical protein
MKDALAVLDEHDDMSPGLFQELVPLALPADRPLLWVVSLSL